MLLLCGRFGREILQFASLQGAWVTFCKDVERMLVQSCSLLAGQWAEAHAQQQDMHVFAPGLTYAGLAKKSALRSSYQLLIDFVSFFFSSHVFSISKVSILYLGRLEEPLSCQLITLGNLTSLRVMNDDAFFPSPFILLNTSLWSLHSYHFSTFSV